MKKWILRILYATFIVGCSEVTIKNQICNTNNSECDVSTKAGTSNTLVAFGTTNENRYIGLSYFQDKDFYFISQNCGLNTELFGPLIFPIIPNNIKNTSNEKTILHVKTSNDFRTIDFQSNNITYKGRKNFSSKSTLPPMTDNDSWQEFVFEIPCKSWTLGKIIVYDNTDNIINEIEVRRKKGFYYKFNFWIYGK